MPPDADTVRQRPGFATGASSREMEEEDRNGRRVGAPSSPESSGGGSRKRLSELRSSEVCIDGVIYDLDGFQHPGGESIHVFGGNDVSVQYKMIHPYHTSKHLDKMRRVGQVTDYKSEYVRKLCCKFCEQRGLSCLSEVRPTDDGTI